MRDVLIFHDLDTYAPTLFEGSGAGITAFQRKFLRTKRQFLHLSIHISGLRTMHMHIPQLVGNLSNSSSITTTSQAPALLLPALFK